MSTQPRPGAYIYADALALQHDTTWFLVRCLLQTRQGLNSTADRPPTSSRSRLIQADPQTDSHLARVTTPQCQLRNKPSVRSLTVAGAASSHMRCSANPRGIESFTSLAAASSRSFRFFFSHQFAFTQSRGTLMGRWPRCVHAASCLGRWCTTYTAFCQK